MAWPFPEEYPVTIKSTELLNQTVWKAGRITPYSTIFYVVKEDVDWLLHCQAPNI